MGLSSRQSSRSVTGRIATANRIGIRPRAIVDATKVAMRADLG
jgi:hypothetical protein